MTVCDYAKAFGGGVVVGLFIALVVYYLGSLWWEEIGKFFRRIFS